MNETAYLIVKKLLRIKGDYLDNIENTEDAKAEIIALCREILNQQQLDINFIELQIQNEVNINSYFDNTPTKDLNFYINMLEALMNVNENMVYYYSQHVSLHNNAYKYYDDLNSIIYDLNKKFLPNYVINKILKTQSKKKECESDLFRELYQEPNSDFYWESLELNKQYSSSRENKIADIGNLGEFVEVGSIFNFNMDINEKISSDLRTYNQLLVSKIKNDFNFNEDYECEGITYKGFQKLLHFKKLEEYMIDYDVSKNITNEQISHILYVFPEFIFAFSLMETTPFYKNYSRQQYKQNNKLYIEHEFFGKLKIKHPELKLHSKATFTDEDEKLIFKLLEKLSLDKNLYNIKDKSFIL